MFQNKLLTAVLTAALLTPVSVALADCDAEDTVPTPIFGLECIENGQVVVIAKEFFGQGTTFAMAITIPQGQDPDAVQVLGFTDEDDPTANCSIDWERADGFEGRSSDLCEAGLGFMTIHGDT